ncbi:MAG: hypothetical protein HRU11_09605 [Parvularculaceae bacterium]|nr:hypothetical protein [Parvularculaceae bacterium]
MTTRMLLAALCLTLAACASRGVTTLSAISAVEPNMSRQQVISLLGQPGRRDLNGPYEALLYCRTGWVSDEYIAIILHDGVVTGTQRYNDGVAWGSCAGWFPGVDWSPPTEER